MNMFLTKFLKSLKIVFKNPKYIILLIGLILIISTSYFYILYISNQSFILFGSIQFGETIEILGIFSLSVLFSISTSMYIYIAKRDFNLKKRDKNLNIIGLFTATFSQLLCCTPIIPFILSTLGISTELLFNLTGKIQGFFSDTWIFFILISLVIVGISLSSISKKVLISNCKNKKMMK